MFRWEGRSSLWAAGLLFVLYFVSRLGSLSVLPIFLDEAVHIQWAERLYEEGRILRPVGAGRLLAVAAYGLALPFDDRLWAARLVACLAGAVTLFFTVALARRVFGERAGLFAGLLYVLSPFALTYDRLALSDGFLSACLTGMMVSTWAVMESPASWRPRIALAATLALAVVAKVSAVLFVISLPLGLLTVARDRLAASRSAVQGVLLAGLAASPMLWFFAQNRGEIVAQHVLDPKAVGAVLATTLQDMRSWVLSYFTLPVVGGAFVSLALVRDGRALWLFGSVALPFLFFALLSQPWSARYVLPVLPPLLVLIAGGIETLVSRFSPSRGALAGSAVVVLLSLPGLSFDRFLLSDPARAPFPPDDRIQLVTGWPAGYGVRELAERLIREASEGGLTAHVDVGGTRTVPASLAILLSSNPKVRLIEGDFGSEEFRISMARTAETTRAFAIVGPRPQDLDLVAAMQGVPVHRVDVYQRPGGEWAATLFRLGVGSNPR